MKKHLSGIGIAVILLASCGEKHEKELNEINDLRVKLVRTDSLLQQVDGEKAEQLATEISNNSKFMQFNIERIKDTLDFKTAIMLSDYHNLVGAFETIAENHDRIEASIDSTSKNLDNLEHDIQNNSLAKGITADAAIDHEEEQINEMYEYAGGMRSTFDKAKVRYDTLALKITDYMKFLNQRLVEKQIETGNVPK